MHLGLLRPGYPVVRIRGAVTGLHNDAKSVCVLAAAGSRVALFGGYGRTTTGSPSPNSAVAEHG